MTVCCPPWPISPAWSRSPPPAHSWELRLVIPFLARISENAYGQTWPEPHRELGKIHVGTFTGPAGTFRQRTEITKPQAAILKALGISARPASTS